jgi:hypothetical protein
MQDLISPVYWLNKLAVGLKREFCDERSIQQLESSDILQPPFLAAYLVGLPHGSSKELQSRLQDSNLVFLVFCLHLNVLRISILFRNANPKVFFILYFLRKFMIFVCLLAASWNGSKGL